MSEINNEILKQLFDNKNCFESNCIFGREVLPNGNEYITISLKDKPVEIMRFWNNPKIQTAKSEPKHSGNKPQYAMAFKSIEDLPNDLAGLMVKLARLGNWNTGEINLTVKDMAKKLKQSERTLYRDLKLLLNEGALFNTEGKYTINKKYAAKGGNKKGTD